MFVDSSRYELHTRYVGGVLKAVPLHPPTHAATSVSRADEWTLDLQDLDSAMTPKTRILVLNNPYVSHGASPAI